MANGTNSDPTPPEGERVVNLSVYTSTDDDFREVVSALSERAANYIINGFQSSVSMTDLADE